MFFRYPSVAVWRNCLPYRCRLGRSTAALRRVQSRKAWNVSAFANKAVDLPERYPLL
jgi:hypothetical protein